MLHWISLIDELRWQKFGLWTSLAKEGADTITQQSHVKTPNLSFSLPELSAMSQPLLSFWKKWHCWKCCHLYYCEYGLQVPIVWLFFCDLPTIFVSNLVILSLTVSLLFNASTISLLLIYHFLLSRSYCLPPLAYQSISPAFCQFFFQALWPSFPSPLSTFFVSTLYLFSSLPLSLVFLSLSASLPFTLWVSLPQLAPPSHHPSHTHTPSSFIFHLCQSPWGCLRESNPPSNSSFYSSYSLSDSRSYSFLYSSSLCSVCLGE